jgi:signal recognition particle receptor subunit beta
MAFKNEERKVICAKILYLGGRGAGKTSNLRALFSLNSEELKSEAQLFSDKEDDSHFFEFLPFSLGKVLDYEVKLHIYSLALNHPLTSLRKIIFTGVDGFVFVVDSRLERFMENRRSLNTAHEFLKEEGYDLSELPHVVQFNKQDESKIIPLAVLSREFNPFEVPEKEAVATQAQGTLETLNLISRQIIDRLVPGYSLFNPVQVQANQEVPI